MGRKRFYSIRTVRNIVRVAVGLLLGAYLFVLFFINFSLSRRFLTAEVSNVLAERLGTEVSVGDVEVGLFNRLVLRDVCLKDRAGEDLLRAGYLSAKIELRGLLRGEVSLRTVALLDADVHLYRSAADAPENFRFILDSFSSKETKDKSALNLRVGSVILRRCNLTYDARYLSDTPGCFNAAHVGVKGLEANVSLKRLTADSLNLRVRSLRFREKCGLEVRNLTLRLCAGRRGGEVSGFELLLPGTRLSEEGLTATYDARGGGEAFWRSLRLAGKLTGARVDTRDIAPLLPRLAGVDRVVSLSANFRVTPRRVDLRRVCVREQRAGVVLDCDCWLLREGGRVKGADGVVRNLCVKKDFLTDIFVRVLRKRQPELLERAGDFRFKGRMRYVAKGRSELTGRLGSDAGELAAVVAHEENRVSVHLKSDGFFPAVFWPARPELGNVVFDLKGGADLNAGKITGADATVAISRLEYNGYEYKGIQVRGGWRRNVVQLSLWSNDPHLSLTAQAEGRFDGRKLGASRLSAEVRNLSPAVLHLTDRFGAARFSASVGAEIRSLDRWHPEGTLSISDFNMKKEDGVYHLDGLQLSVVPRERGSRVSLRSDFAHVEMEGPLSAAGLRVCLDNMVGRSLSGWREVRDSRDEWRFTVRLKKTDFLNELFGVPLSLEGPVEAEGTLRSDGTRNSLTVRTDGLEYDGTALRKLRLYLSGAGSQTTVLAQLEKNIGGTDMKFALDAHARDGELLTELAWDDGRTHKYCGKVSAHTVLGKPADGAERVLETRIIPTSVTVNDSLWQVSSGSFLLGKDKMEINDFRLSHKDESLVVDGGLSRDSNDSLVIDLNRIDVDYILNLVDFHAVDFSGYATGKFKLSKSQDRPLFTTRLKVSGFRFNDAYLGEADIRGRWNRTEKRIELEALMTENGVGETRVSGYVSPPAKKLDLDIRSKNTNLRFLQRYVADIFSGLEGRTTGRCHLFGPFKQLDFEGQEEAEVSAHLLSTGVEYSLSGGSVDITPGRFSFRNFDIKDKGNGSGRVSGYLVHSHLSDLRYQFNVRADRLLVYDKPQEMDMPFYSTTYGTGTMRLEGRPGVFNADINIRPEARTQFVYTIDTPDTFGDVQLVSFEDKTRRTVSGADERKAVPVPKKEPPSSTDIRLNFLVDMNPDATLKVIMDEKSGDNIVVNGRGTIRASFYNKGHFEMFGTYTVERGTYKMSIQDLIRKDFELASGGRIVFAGDPFDGNLDLRAVYVVNSASLSDLNIGTGFSENTARVNCILDFSGKVHSPQVSFDLELPTVSDDEEQMVRNLIRTEEDMNMQIIYLLGVGRFYTYDYGNTETATRQSQSSVAMKSFLSNTLSSQLNSILSNAIGSSNWTFGTNLSTGSVGWSDMEVDGLLSGRLLNNRLIFNGNFGYRERTTSSTNFVGDFDLRYLLTPNGSVSLKAYSETNDRYFSRSSLTTQGGGIMLKRDFSNLKDLFTIKKNRKRRKADTGISREGQ